MIFPFISVGPYDEPINDLFGVQMPTTLGGNEQSWLGVLGQEVYEFRTTWAHLVASFTKGNAFAADMEIQSHAVELEVAVRFDGRDRAGYRDLMITRLDDARAYRRYGYYQGMSRDDLAKAFDAQQPAASAWVNGHAAFFDSWMSRRPA